jgi:uncharacterized caspase-like protein
MAIRQTTVDRASRLAAFVLLLVLSITVSSTQALADRRVALVIGNSAYQNVARLPNPARDASAIADMLKKAGFDVVNARQDVGNADMRRMVRDFSDQVADADVALVYYAGHGIEINGTNYVLPIDVKLARDVDAEDEAVSLDRIVRTLDPVRKLRLVILDACRDNPFQQTMKRSISSRGVSRGLAKVEPENPNTLIAYAAKAGSTASDGDGDHSPFTTGLLKQLPVPGQDLRKSLGYVRDDVLKQTNNKQEPFVYGSLGGDDVVLVPKPAAAVPAQVMALDPNSQLRQDYLLAAQINTEAAWDAFLKSYPNGYYGDLARAARAKLTAPPAAQVAAATSSDRNLSEAQPTDHALPGTAPRPTINDLAGKSFVINFDERLEQADGGKVDHASRELTIYVASGSDVSSRLASVPLLPANILRYARAPIGAADRGVQVSYGNNQLIYVIPGPNYRVKVTATAVGNSCTATAEFELNPDQAYYLFGRAPTGQPYKLKSMTGENVVCSVSAGDAVGPVPTTSQQ